MSKMTVVDVIDVIANSKSEINLKSFQYTKISSSSEQVGYASENDKRKMIDKLASAKNAVEMQEIADQASKLAYEKSHLNFVWAKNNHCISSIHYNETRPNVSMAFQIDGTINLPSDSPTNLPKDFPTHIYRNFNVIHDGELNIDSMIVKMDSQTCNYLHSNGVVMQDNGNGEYLIDLTSLPLYNASNNDLKASEVVDKIYTMMSNKAIIKVCKAFMDSVKPIDKSKNLISVYGTESGQYLSELGITDNGFSPKSQQKPSTSTYNVKEFLLKFKGISSIPSYNAFVKKIKEGKKLNNGDMLLQNIYDTCVANSTSMSENDFITWLESEINKANTEIKNISRWFSTIKFDILVNKKWFVEFNNKNDCHINYKGIDVEILEKDSVVEI